MYHEFKFIGILKLSWFPCKNKIIFLKIQCSTTNENNYEQTLKEKIKSTVEEECKLEKR